MSETKKTIPNHEIPGAGFFGATIGSLLAENLFRQRPRENEFAIWLKFNWQWVFLNGLLAIAVYQQYFAN